MSTEIKKMVTPEDFVTAWQTSTSAQEVARKLGLSHQSVLNRAQNYRKKGVPLKKYGEIMRCNYDALADLAKKLSNDPNKIGG